MLHRFLFALLFTAALQPAPCAHPCQDQCHRQQNLRLRPGLQPLTLINLYGQWPYEGMVSRAHDINSPSSPRGHVYEYLITLNGSFPP